MRNITLIKYTVYTLLILFFFTSCRRESCNKWSAYPDREIFIAFTKEGEVLPDSIGKQFRIFTIYKGDTVTNPGMIKVIDGEMPFPGYDMDRYLYNADEQMGYPPGTKPGLYKLYYTTTYYIAKNIDTYYLEDTVSNKTYEIKISVAYYDDPCEAKRQPCQCSFQLLTFSFEGVQLHSDSALARKYDINTPMYEIFALEVE